MNLNEIFELKNEGGFIFALNTFVDIFTSSKQKMDLVNEEPKIAYLMEEEFCILAASIHYLCNQFGLLPPNWVFDNKYISSEPYYAFHTKNKDFQNYLRTNTPVEFKIRNLFVGENAISRV